MSFTIIEPGTVITPPAPRRPRPSRLAYVERGWTSASVYEPVKAATETDDGAPEWLFVRADDGTWDAGHLPTETEVKTGLRSLGACQAYTGSGRAAADLERIQARDGNDGGLTHG